LARAAFGDADPIGKSISFESGENRIVVGVVEDYREFGPAQAAPQVAFLPYTQGGNLWNATMHGVLKLRGPAPSERDIRELARDIAPDLAVVGYGPLARNLDGILGPQRMARAFMLAFAAMALLLAAGGVYGLMAATVAERKGEFGVRAALGATMKDLLSLVLGESAKLASAGAALGLLLGLALRATAGGWFDGLPAASATAPLAAAALLICSAISATLLPALRAARVDPMEALRSE
jgi:ABC-type lipoprotein release transport system permease subunit